MAKLKGGTTIAGNVEVSGDIKLTGTATTTNQGRLIDFTGFDKEGTTDFTDRAYIQHTTNTGGHSGSVLVISSQNDASDGIAFQTNSSSKLKHNGNNVLTTADSYVSADTSGSASYPRLVVNNSGATHPGWIRVFSNSHGILPYSNGNSYIGTSSWRFAQIHGVNIYENGTALSSKYAPLASPALTGTPTAPTAANTTNSTQIATTAFVQNKLASIAGGLNFKGTVSLSGGKSGDDLYGSASGRIDSSGDYLIVSSAGDITNPATRIITLAAESPGDESDSTLPITLEVGDWIMYESFSSQTLTVVLLNNNDATKAAATHTHSNYLTSNAEDLYTPARLDLGSTGNWDAVGYGNQTNLHFRDHNQFWIGAGNGTWFTGTANTKSQASGLAADASAAHDLLMTTMQSTSTYDRGITFAVDSNAGGTAGWRLGKWHSGTSATNSMLAVNGQIHAKGGHTDSTDYYQDDYSTYHSTGNGAWPGDTNAGWHKPSIVAAKAIQIQSGTGATNSSKPQIQFHQYGYGGPGIEYDGPNKTLTIGELGSSTSNRLDNVNIKTVNNLQVNGNIVYHEGNLDGQIPVYDGVFSGQALNDKDEDVMWSTGYSSGGSGQPTNWVTVFNVPGPGAIRGFQVASYFGNSNQFYMRSQYDGGSGSWNSWERLFTEAYHPNADKWTTARTLTLTGDVTGSASWDGSANASITTTVVNDSHNHNHSDGDFTVNGNLYGKSVNAQYSNLYRFGGLFFTWDSDTYGTNTHHSMRSTYGDTYGDDLTINSFHHLRVNLDSNNNNSDARFEIGHNTTGTANLLFVVNENGDVGIGTGNTPGYKLNVNGDAFFADTVTIDTGTSVDALVIKGTSPTISLLDDTSGADDFYIHTNSNNFYVLTDRDGGNQVGTGYESPHPLQLEADTNIGYVFGQRIFNELYHPNADKWTTARTITLGGDLTGNVSIDGSANVTLSAQVVDSSHSHSISNVSGLQAALDDKAEITNTVSGTTSDVSTLNFSLSGSTLTITTS